MLSLKELEQLADQDALEDKAEDLASLSIQLTRADIQAAYAGQEDADTPQHVYGLAGLKASWMESLLIGRWIAEAKNEILAKLEETKGS